MEFDNYPKKLINKILTVISALILMIWAWKWLGPGSEEVRGRGIAQAAKAGMSFGDLVWIGIAVACGGYLLWRFMSYIFWKKYFKDELPPDEPEE